MAKMAYDILIIGSGCAGYAAAMYSGRFQLKTLLLGDAIGEEYQSKTIILATGTKHKELGIPGEKEFTGSGIHTCMLCDGYFYRNKVIGVVGGSDSAAEEALLGTQWAKKVYIIYRGEQIHPEPINMQRVLKNKKIEIINKTNVIEIKGDSLVRSV